MRSVEGEEEYKKRKGTVEWHFGNIKQNLKFREFHTRGLENVRIEPTLVCMANNLEVMWGKLGSSVAALSNIKRLIANFAFRVSSITSWSVKDFRFILIYGH